MYPFSNRKSGIKTKRPMSHARLTIVVSFIATFLCFPWAYLLTAPENTSFLGLPLIYFLNVLLFPVLVLALLFWYGRKADQTDRYEQ